MSPLRNWLRTRAMTTSDLALAADVSMGLVGFVARGDMPLAGRFRAYLESHDPRLVKAIDAYRQQRIGNARELVEAA
jgi:hypothetical protein